jgi:hypothetical protein
MTGTVARARERPDRCRKDAVEQSRLPAASLFCIHPWAPSTRSESMRKSWRQVDDLHVHTSLTAPMV